MDYQYEDFFRRKKPTEFIYLKSPFFELTLNILFSIMNFIYLKNSKFIIFFNQTIT
ncbi:hypothetical protein BH10BAC5_BH10BAC5_24150 [soil metagenome]